MDGAIVDCGPLLAKAKDLHTGDPVSGEEWNREPALMFESARLVTSHQSQGVIAVAAVALTVENGITIAVQEMQNLQGTGCAGDASKASSRTLGYQRKVQRSGQYEGKNGRSGLSEP